MRRELPGFIADTLEADALARRGVLSRLRLRAPKTSAAAPTSSENAPSVLFCPDD